MRKEKKQTFRNLFRMQKMLSPGFTLLEIIIATSIIIIVTSFSSFGYVEFNDRLENTNLAVETALLLREAQISGVSVRGNPTDGTFENAWGVHAKIIGNSTDSSDSRIILFVDSDNDEIYDGDLINCPGEECVSALDMRRNNILGKICRITDDEDLECYPESDLAGFSAIFKRPKPDARISFLDSDGNVLPEDPNVVGAQICIQSPRNRLSSVEVLKTGKISVKKECPS